MLRRGIRHLCLENWATNLENWATNVPVPGATTAFASFHPIRVQRPPSSCHRISCGQTKGSAKPFLQMGWPQDPWMSPWGQGRGCASALWGGEGGSCPRACFHEKPEVCLCPGCGNAPGAASPAPAGPEGGAGQCCQLGGGIPSAPSSSPAAANPSAPQRQRNRVSLLQFDQFRYWECHNPQGKLLLERVRMSPWKSSCWQELLILSAAASRD